MSIGFLALSVFWSDNLRSTEKLVRKTLTVLLGQGTISTGDRTRLHRVGLKLNTLAWPISALIIVKTKNYPHYFPISACGRVHLPVEKHRYLGWIFSNNSSKTLCGLWEFS